MAHFVRHSRVEKAAKHPRGTGTLTQQGTMECIGCITPEGQDQHVRLEAEDGTVEWIATTLCEKCISDLSERDRIELAPG